MAPPRRYRWRISMGALVACLASCGSAPAENGPATEGTTPPGAAVDTSRSTAAAGAANGGPHLWINATTVPVDGGPIAFAVVVPPGTGPAETSGGVEGSLERLKGSTWKPVGRYGSSLDFWGGFGTVVGANDDLAVAAIGVVAPAEGAGQLQFVMLPALEAGRYRLRSGKVSGEFDVRSDAPALPPLHGQERGGLGLLGVSPGLMPTSGGPITITANVGSSIDEVNAFAKALGADADVEQWTGTSWTPQGTYPVTPAPISNSTSVAITLPTLPEGMYRVVRHHPSGDLSREFWVTSDLDAVAANVRSFTIAGWTLVGTYNGSQFGRADGSTLSVEVTELSAADPRWQPGASMEVQSRPTVRGRPAALVSIRDGGPNAARLIVLSDTTKRLVIRASESVTDAELVAAVESLEPFPLAADATVPDVAGRLTGSVAELAGQEGAATVTGWLVVAGDGTYRLCDQVERGSTLRCTGPSLEVDASFTKWDPPALTTVGAERVSTEPATLSGSLKGDILYIGVL